MAAKLFGDVREWVPRDRRFQVLVLANLCAVIARELRAGAEPTLADVRLFRELLRAPTEPAVPPQDAAEVARAAAGELAAAIRRGELDDRLDEAIARLREHVRRKLEIARPGYADETAERPGRPPIGLSPGRSASGSPEPCRVPGAAGRGEARALTGSSPSRIVTIASNGPSTAIPVRRNRRHHVLGGRHAFDRRRWIASRERPYGHPRTPRRSRPTTGGAPRGRGTDRGSARSSQHCGSKDRLTSQISGDSLPARALDPEPHELHVSGFGAWWASMQGVHSRCSRVSESVFSHAPPSMPISWPVT